MFSENNRISGRQAVRLLTFDLLGIGTLLLPQILGRVAGVDGIFCIGIGVAAGLLYLRLIDYVMPEAGMDFSHFLKLKLGKTVGCMVLFGCLIYFLLFAGYTAYIFVDVVLSALLREESFYLVLAVLMVLAAYGLWGGIEGRARIYEILFWFILLPLAFMLFAALDEIQTDYWTPVFTAGAAGVLAGSYEVFRSLSVLFFLLFLRGYMREKRTILRAGRASLLLTGGIYAVLYLILLGIFGAGALAQMEYPAVILMSTVKISGGFLKRTDAFIFAVWFFTLYALHTSCIFYAGNALMGVAGNLRKHAGTEHAGTCMVHGARRNRAVVYTAVLLLTAGIACVCYKSREAFWLCEQFLRYIGTPFLILVPLLLATVRLFSGEDGSKKSMRKRTVRGAEMLVILLFAGSVLTGCNTEELEERNFPIEAAVQNPDDFAAEWTDARGSGNRVIDYSHLKVMVLNRAFLEDEEKMQEFLQFMEKENEVPRNTYVVVAEDADELLTRMEDTGESLGNYLEELFENVSEVKKRAYPTLGMLYQEKENACETLFIPYVSMREEKPVVETYYVWKRGEPAGLVNREAAMLFFFTENEMDTYMLPLPGGGVVSLTGAHNEIGFREKEAQENEVPEDAGTERSSGKREIVVKIRCSGELSGGTEVSGQSAGESREQNAGESLRQRADEVQRVQVLRQVAAYMNELAQKTLSVHRIDLSGSYRKLPGSRRDWYEEYRMRNTEYETDMDIVYEVRIDWVNL